MLLLDLQPLRDATVQRRAEYVRQCRQRFDKDTAPYMRRGAGQRRKKGEGE